MGTQLRRMKRLICEVSERFVRKSNFFCNRVQCSNQMSLGHVPGFPWLDALQSAGSAPSLDGPFADIDVEILGIECSSLFGIVVFFNHALIWG